MHPAIEVRNLVKTYGSLRAVDDVSFTVEAGDVFAFLGPNGAGKTTSINAMVGLAGITSGSIALFGHDVVRDWRAARRLVGVAPQDYAFDRYLSIRDVLIYQAGYYGVPRREAAPRADALLERFNLSEKAGQTVTNLSGGMKRRLTLARALVHSPRLLILDEPTAGVDVELRLELWELIRTLNADGMTILLTTHYLEEAEELCRTVAIIDGGKLRTIQPTRTLLAGRARDKLHITLERALPEIPPALLAFGATRNADDPRGLDIAGLEPALYPRFFAALEQSGSQIADVALRRTNLHDVFLDLVKQR
jgi:ABC-2 type transport system ATP-binding protein